MLPNQFFLLFSRIYSNLETFNHVVSPPFVGGSKVTDRYSVPVLSHTSQFPESADHIFILADAHHFGSLDPTPCG